MNGMNGTKTRKLLAMVLSLLLCVLAAGALADADLGTPPSAVSESGGQSSGKELPVAMSAPAEVTKEEAPSTEAKEEALPTHETDQPDGKEQDISGPPTSIDATEGEAPVESGEATDQIAGDKQDSSETPAPIPEPEDEIPNEVGEEEPEQPIDEEPMELGEDGLELLDEEIEDAQEASEINPVIRLFVSIDGEVLTEGTQVTIRSDINGIPDGAGYSLQWQNDLSGEFRDVPGETGERVTFSANEQNVNCAWRLILTPDEAEIA